MSRTPSPPENRPRFRIQEAILILRQGKSHPQWREAAWHLIEHAGKDTQLLLEAQRDLLDAAVPAEKNPWPKYIGLAVLGGILLIGMWLVLSQVPQLRGSLC